MKLTYWVAPRRDDSTCYSIRRKTRKAVIEELVRQGFQKVEKADEWTDEGDYVLPCDGGRLHCGYPRKITVIYTDALDLLQQATSESGIDES